MRLLYSLVWWLVLPLVLLRLWRRGRKEPGYRAHVGERLGFYSQEARLSGPQARFIWVHAVSVGETRAAEPLIDALLQQYPQHSILLTCMTATSTITSGFALSRSPTNFAASAIWSGVPRTTSAPSEGSG